MGGDYPDWTDLIHLVGTDIMLAIDVQGAYIMMPVDIQGQIGELNINITASEVIITIDIEAQSVGIWLQADWQAKEGTDKRIKAEAANYAFDTAIHADYEVTEGKTFYVCALSFTATATAAADYDHFCYAEASLILVAPFTTKFLMGGLGGGAVSFSAPYAFTEGQIVRAWVNSKSNIGLDVGIVIWGFEI